MGGRQVTGMRVVRHSNAQENAHRKDDVLRKRVDDGDGAEGSCGG